MKKGLFQIPIFLVAGSWDRQVKAMKNELMLQFLLHPLPRKRPEYIPYRAKEWSTFVAEKNHPL